MNLEAARAKATALRNAIAPFCVPDHCLIVGSVRREKPDPGDVEICALANLRDYEAIDGIIKLLGSQRFGVVKTGMFPARMTTLDDGICKLEIAWQSKQSWGLNTWIRTGPADYVARGLGFWKKVTEGGYSGGAILHLANGEQVPTLTEQSVFAAFDAYARIYAEKHKTKYVPVKWIEPKNRR